MLYPEPLFVPPDPECPLAALPPEPPPDATCALLDPPLPAGAPVTGWVGAWMALFVADTCEPELPPIVPPEPAPSAELADAEAPTEPPFDAVCCQPDGWPISCGKPGLPDMRPEIEGPAARFRGAICGAPPNPVAFPTRTNPCPASLRPLVTGAPPRSRPANVAVPASSTPAANRQSVSASRAGRRGRSEPESVRLTAGRPACAEAGRTTVRRTRLRPWPDRRRA